MTRVSTLLVLCTLTAFGCGERPPREGSSSDVQAKQATAVHGALDCAQPAEGCACAGNQPPVACKPDTATVLEARAPDAGPRVCQEGTRHCRNGRFSACEDVVSYTSAESPRPTSLVDQLAQHAHCSDCEATCFRVDDNLDPADGPLDASIATGVKYHSSGAGVTLAPRAGLPGPAIPDGGVPDGSLYLALPEGLSASDMHTSRVNPSQGQVYLLLDQSSSMAEETQWLYDDFDTGSLLAAPVACTDGDQSLADDGISGALRCILRNPRLGLGMFRDIPFAPYASDQSLPVAEREQDAEREIAYANARTQTSNLSRVKLALTQLGSVQSSGDPDVAGSQIVALHAVATGQGMFMGLTRPALLDAQCPGGRFGYPCFANGSKPVVILITDAPFHNGPSPSTYPYDYDLANLAMLEGTTPGLSVVPRSANDWGSALMLSGDASSALTALQGSTAPNGPSVSPGVVGCDANNQASDAVIRFDVAAPGPVGSTAHVALSTEGSSLATSLAVFSGPVPTQESLPAADTTNELFSSAYAIGNVTAREVLVQGATADPMGASPDMAADYQGSLYGTACGADTFAPDAVFSFDVSASPTPTDVELSLDMGTAHAVLAVYEAGAGPPPRWPATVTPLMPTGNTDANEPEVFKIPSGAGNEYISVVGDTTSLGADYDQSVLGGNSCSPDSSSKDVGFKIHLDAPGTLRFDTEGSSFDTVLSLHDLRPLNNAGNIVSVSVPNTNESAGTAYDAGSVNDQRQRFSGDTTGMTSDVTDNFGCGMDNDSACGDAVYAITVAKRTTLRMQVAGTGYEPALLVTRFDPAGASGRYPSLALGESHSCALSGGQAYCWGADDVGQLGNGGGAGDPDSSAPVQVTSLTGAVQLGAGRNHTCAVKDDGTVYCWGAGGAGQLGDGASSDRYAAVQVLGIGGVGALGDAVQVACGASHCCALRRSGAAAVCWGDNTHGQLGDGSVAQSPTPVLVASSDVFEQIAANDDHSCAIRASDKAVFCWGSGAYGKTGNAAGTDDLVPHQVSGLGPVSSLMTGQDHNCAVLTNGHVSCWGHGDSGQLGQGDDVTDHATPVTVLGSDGTPLANVKGGFAAGRAHSCVALLSGLVQCWGDNASSQLGNDSTAPALLATDTFDILDALQVVSSSDHSCALRAEGSLVCWGDGAHGKLGNAASATAPKPVVAQAGSPHVSFGTGTLDVGFSSACGPLAQPPEPGCVRTENNGQSYFVCNSRPRTFAGAAQACAAVGYELVDIDAAGENAFVASQLGAQSWIGAKRESSADWLNLPATLHFDDLAANQLWFTEAAGYDDCSGSCSWVPPRGFFTYSADPDLISSEPWSAFSTWGTDDEPSSQPGRNCVTLDPFGKWATNACAVTDPTAPWLADPAMLVARSLAGRLAAPDFAGGAEHDYACEQRAGYTDLTLDPGKYFVTVKGSDGGVAGHACSGPYQLQIDDLSTPSGGYITCDDNGVAGTTASVIERSLAAGDYYLVLKGKSSGDQGNYQLTVRDVGAVQTGELACDASGGFGDPAKLRVTAQPGKTYYALVKGQAPVDKGAYTLDVRDVGPAVGALVQCDADSGPAGSSSLSLDLQTGSYYAVLTGRGSDTAGTYRLALGGAAPVSSTFVPPSYADTLTALTQNHIRVGTVLSCDTSSPSCADAQAQAMQLAADTLGALRVAAGPDDVPAQVVRTVQILESLDTLSAQLLFTPDSDPGFVSAGVTAIADVNGQCTLGSDGMSFRNCLPGASASFSVSLTNPALRPVPPSMGPLGAYQFTLRITGQRDGDTVFSEDVPVLAAPTGAAPPMTYTSGSYHQDFDSRGCLGNTRPSWDRLTVDSDVRPDTSVRFDACTADNLPDLALCDAGAPSSGYKRVLTITAGTGNGTPCTVASQDVDCPDGFCSPYTSICNHLEGVTCTQDSDCPGNTVGRCRAGPSVATLGYTCEVVGLTANPAGALRGDNYRVSMRLRADLESLGDGSRTPSVFFFETQYNCQAIE